MANKNKQTTFADMIADSAPETREVQVGGHTVTVRELSGRERFELAELDGSQWDLLVWLCLTAMTDPKPESVEEIDQLKPEWVADIAKAVMEISGVTDDAIEEAGKESGSVTAIGGS